MKTISFLVFNKNGEIVQKSTKYSVFEPESFPEFKHYKRYNDYVILYNVESNSKNLTKFYFTEDTYSSDVAVLKVQENEIKNLTYKMYTSRFLKISYEPNDYYSDSDTEIEDISPFVY